MKYVTRLLTTHLLLFACTAAFAQTDFDVVKTAAGAVSGTVNTDGDIHIFKGIPFAAPPVGDLRWKAPQPVQSWSGVKKCDAFSPSPMQAPPAPFSMIGRFFCKVRKRKKSEYAYAIIYAYKHNSFLRHCFAVINWNIAAAALKTTAVNPNQHGLLCVSSFCVCPDIQV